jgi:acetoin utilization protein AcuB
MIAGQLINDMIPPLKPSDTTQQAVKWMEELRVNQLPVVEKRQFLGLASEDILLQSEEADQLLSEQRLVGQDCYVYEYQHFYDILKVASRHGVQVVAVLSADQKFKGVITVEDTVTAFAQTAAVESPGGIIVLSMRQIDYSLAEISRLVESNGAKILSSGITTDPIDPSKLKLTLKVNKTDLSDVIATLERFGYRIIAKFQETKMESQEKERLDILMKYLDI